MIGQALDCRYQCPALRNGATSGKCPLSSDSLEHWLERANHARRAAIALDAEVQLCIDVCLGAGRSLAVYGSLAPGQINHHLLSGLRADWSTAEVEAVPVQRGWGVRQGFAALQWSPGASRQAVHVVRSEDLASLWPELDAFEGADYVRTFVPLWHESDLVGVANLYSAR